MQATLGCISASLINLSEGEADKERGQVFTFKLHTDSFLTAGHVLGHIINLLTDSFFANGLSGIKRISLFTAVRSANPWHVDIGEEAVGVICLLGLLSNGGEAD